MLCCYKNNDYIYIIVYSLLYRFYYCLRILYIFFFSLLSHS